jgi:peptide/nickel transport system substrate-binding protein
MSTSTDDVGVVTVTTASDDSFTRKTAEGTLTVGTMTSAADSLDPALTEGIGCFPVFDQLFKFDENGELVGELVESWEYLDEENTQLQLKIHEGVMFSNGEEMTAEDVIYSLDRFDDVGSSYTYWADINFDESYIVDDYTLVLVCDSANVALTSKMTTFRGSVVCKSWAESASDEDWWDSAVGSGPYVCTENTSGSQSVFTAREDYWQGTPEYSTITVKYYTEQTTMMVDYENGVLDVCYDLNASNINRVMNGDVSNSTLNLDPNTLTWTIYLPQKSEDSPMNNELFRKAFVEALDMEGLGIAVADDLATVADSIITAASKMNTTDSYQHVYDPEQAAADLEAAGYQPGEVTLTVTIEGGSGYKEIAEAVQAYEAEIGINVEISEADIPTLIGRLMGCEDDFCFNKLADIIADAETYYDFNSDASTALQVSYSDETFNNDCLEARKVADRDARADLYSEAWQSLYDQYYVIPCFNVYYGYICRDYITDCSMIQYNYIDVTRITSK